MKVPPPYIFILLEKSKNEAKQRKNVWGRYIKKWCWSVLNYVGFFYIKNLEDWYVDHLQTPQRRKVMVPNSIWRVKVMYTTIHCCRRTFEGFERKLVFFLPYLYASVQKTRFSRNYSRIQKKNTNIPTMGFLWFF